MRLRKLTLAIGLASALGANIASALGLGEIQLLSRLNEPLVAEIKLLQARDLTPDEILIALAQKEDFSRAGIERPFFLTSLKFTVNLDSPNGPVVRVTSTQPVREPYLNFLLDTQWPNGRILREYTLLMDLPVFSDESARPIQSAQTSSPSRAESSPTSNRQITPRADDVTREPATTEDQNTPQQQSPQRREPSSSAQSGSGNRVYGPVSANDTLWEIALKVRPNRQYSVQQTMLAIQRLNPEAFINGNINLLRRGQVLRVPAAGDIQQTNFKQAINEVAFQNNQWSGSAAGPQLEATGRSRTTNTSDNGISGRLKVATADSRSDLEAGRASGEVGGDVESLQNELAISLEELDKSRRQNNDLSERVNELEAQIETMERLLEVSNQELRALQLGAEQSQAASAAQEDKQTQVAASQSKPVAVAQPQKPEPAKVVKQAAPKEPSLADRLMDNLVYIGGGFIALLLAGLLIVRRRQQQNDADNDDSPEVDLSFTDPDNSDSLIGLDDEISNFSPEEESSFDQSDDDDFYLDNLEADAETSSPTHSQTGDAGAEADIYIAYGKFDQAEEMLLNALAANETDVEARLKLLEVYAETNNIDSFDKQLSILSGFADSESIDRAHMLREQFDDAPEFVASKSELSLDESGMDFSGLTASDESDIGDTASDLTDLDLDFSSDALSFDISEKEDSLADLDHDDLVFGLDLDETDDRDFNLDSAISSDDEFSLDLSDDLTKLEQPENKEDTDDISFDFSLADDDDDIELESLNFDVDLETDNDDSLADAFAPEASDTELSDSDVPTLDVSDAQAFSLEDESLDTELVPEPTPESDASVDFENTQNTELEDSTDNTIESAQEPELEEAVLPADVPTLEDIDDDIDIVEAQEDSADDFEFSFDEDETLDASNESEMLEATDSSDADSALQSEASLDSLGGDSESLDSAVEDDFWSESEDEDGFAMDLDEVDLDALDQELEALSLESSDSDTPEAEAAEPEISEPETLESETSELETLVPETAEPEIASTDINLDETLDSATSSDFELDDDDEADIEFQAQEAEALFDSEFTAEDESVEAAAAGDSDVSDADTSNDEDTTPESEAFSLADQEAGLELENEDSDSDFLEDLSLDDDETPPFAFDSLDTASSSEDDANQTDSVSLELTEEPELEPVVSEEQEALLDVDEDQAALTADSLDDEKIAASDSEEQVEKDSLFGEEGTAVEAEPDAAEEVADLYLTASEDDVFDEALSDLPTPEESFSIDELDDDLDDDLDFLADTDEAATKLDLARAYIDMGDQEGAKDILEEVQQEGNTEQQQEAKELIERLS